MRHRRSAAHLGRTSSGYKALMRSLAAALFLHERIKTTLKKTRQAGPFSEKLITLGKKNTPTAKKTAISILGSKALIKKLFEDIAPRFAARNGGYTRVLRLGRRKGDGTEMAILELTERKIVEKAKKEKEKKKEKSAEAALRPEPKEKAKEREPEKPKEEKDKEKIKREKDKLSRSFFKGLKRYFRGKSE